MRSPGGCSGWVSSILLLPPARTDLTEITVYSSGLIQVMPKGSVRWETIPLKVEASEVWRILTLLLGSQSKAINEATPSVHGRLPATPHNPGGGRIKVLHPVIAPGDGYPSVNIRLYEQKPVHPEWLLERGLMSDEMMEFLGSAVRDGKRILITGGTRTGKTTLLSALCNYLPEGWRIVKIEDPAEIWIDRATVQTIESRPVPPGSEVPPYTLADGVDDAMRMSPDYLIVGEVRDGRAALAMFRALLTGHSGASTFHANSPREAFRRLATIMGADENVRPHEAAQVIADSLDSAGADPPAPGGAPGDRDRPDRTGCPWADRALFASSGSISMNNSPVGKAELDQGRVLAK